MDAALEFERIGRICSYVSKERFAVAAKCVFGISDEKAVDRMYGILNIIPMCVHRLVLDERYAKEKGEEIGRAIEIGETAFVKREVLMKWVPGIESGVYSQKDFRRYFYVDGEEPGEVDINLRDAQNIVMLSNLLCRDGVRMTGVAQYIDSLNARTMAGGNGGKDRVDYFEGDIVFVFGNPSDRWFYSWYKEDAGVYLATLDGWRKLLYTPGRGYLGKDGEPDFESDTLYNNYKIEASGTGFRFVGNIHKDIAVLVDPEKK